VTDRELLQQSLKELEYYETIFDESNINKVIETIRTRLEQLDADAVAWINPITLQDLKDGKEGVHLVYEVEMVGSIPLFEYQPEKEWVGLTDKEVVMLAYQSKENECTAIRLAEAKLKEKNSG
jgi:hypothetical protein